MYTLSASPAGPTLPTLATELVEIVGHCIEPTDLLSLRLVCKELQQKSLRVFGNLLATIRTDLCEKSVQGLRALCTPELRLYVKRLIIEPGEDGEFGKGLQWRRPASKYVDVLPLQDLLTHSLQNCRSLQIRNPGGMEDESHALTYSDAVGLVLLLIPNIVTTSPVTAFILSSQSHGNSFLDATKLPIEQCRQPSFLHAWAHVRELVLEQHMRPETFAWSLDLVLYATSLRVLSLSFVFDESEAFIERVCASDFAPRSLESLSLASCRMNVAHLSKLVQQCHGTLRALRLQHISIPRVNDWPTALGQLKSQAPLLESISVLLLVASGDEPRSRLMFPGLETDHVVPGSKGRKMVLRTKRWKGDKRVFGVSYQGPCMGKALDMMVRAAEPI